MSEERKHVADPEFPCGPKAVLEVRRTDDSGWVSLEVDDNQQGRVYDCIHEAQHQAARCIASMWAVVVLTNGDFDHAMKAMQMIRCREIGEEKAKPIADSLFTKLMTKSQ